MLQPYVCTCIQYSSITVNVLLYAWSSPLQASACIFSLWCDENDSYNTIQLRN